MALGWDTVWAEALIELEVPFLAAIPFEGQESRWPQESQKKYHDLLKKADRVEIISPGGYAAWKMHVRNEWMVDNCDRVVALWDGGDDGGTAACVRYATKRKVPVDNLWDMYRQDLIS